jgi:hypothetical protein
LLVRSSRNRLAHVQRLDDAAPLLCGNYSASSLLRAAPPPCLALVLSLLRVCRLSFSLDIETTGSCVPYKSLMSGSCRLYAGRRADR